MASQFIGAKTRTEFREYFVTTTLGVIHDSFQGGGFEANLEYEPSVGGQRRTLVEQYYRNVDWTSPAHTRRVLQIYETVLGDLDLIAASVDPNAAWAKGTASGLRHWLARDGIQESDGRLLLPGHGVLDGALVAIDLPELQRQVDRMRAAVDSDPGLAIGTAKELLETTCKTILSGHGVAVDDGWAVPRLVKETRKLLALLPSDVPDSAKGASSIHRLLSNLGTIANSLAELRNLYGTGHGKHGDAKGVLPRHARLAVGAAATLATFLFETHEDRSP